MSRIWVILDAHIRVPIEVQVPHNWEGTNEEYRQFVLQGQSCPVNLAINGRDADLTEVKFL